MVFFSLKGHHPCPQHDPGPAQPSAWPGRLPQHPVSWGPGRFWPLRPVRLLVADMSLLVFSLPQDGQARSDKRTMVSTSPTWPQSAHRIS
jgi:hypothetical protein